MNEELITIENGWVYVPVGYEFHYQDGYGRIKLKVCEYVFTKKNNVIDAVCSLIQEKYPQCSNCYFRLTYSGNGYCCAKDLKCGVKGYRRDGKDVYFVKVDEDEEVE